MRHLCCLFIFGLFVCLAGSEAAGAAAAQSTSAQLIAAHISGPDSFQATADGAKVAFRTGDVVCVWSLTGKTLRGFLGTSEIRGCETKTPWNRPWPVGLSADGSVLAYAAVVKRRPSIVVRNLETDHVTVIPGFVLGGYPAMSNDGRFLVAGRPSSQPVRDGIFDLRQRAFRPFPKGPRGSRVDGGAISGDGSAALYAVTRDAATRWYWYSRATGAHKLLGGGSQDPPSLSGNGEVAIVPGLGLYTGVTGTNDRRFSFAAGNVSLTADASTLALTCPTLKPTHNVYLLSRATGEYRTLPPVNGASFTGRERLVITADGTAVFAEALRRHSAQLYRIPTAGAPSFGLTPPFGCPKLR